MEWLESSFDEFGNGWDFQVFAGSYIENQLGEHRGWIVSRTSDKKFWMRDMYSAKTSNITEWVFFWVITIIAQTRNTVGANKMYSHVLNFQTLVILSSYSMCIFESTMFFKDTNISRVFKYVRRQKKKIELGTAPELNCLMFWTVV